MPTKRDRGKQRKAVKNLAAGNGNDSITQIVAKVRKGDHNTTILLGDASPKHSLEESNGISYEQSGILSTVLKFLKRCEDDTFTKVMLEVGGNLITPASWVRVLIKAEVQEEGCRLHIAQSIGPLVRCMCNDMKRQFFKSNNHWVNTIHSFVCLVHNIILHSADNSDKTEGKKIIDTLLQYERLLTSIIQWGFWDEKYRPDIAKELATDYRAKIVELSKVLINWFIIKAADTDTEEGRERLEIIGTTPIISREYDPECTNSFVVRLVRQVKIGDWTLDTSTALRRLIANVSCVDKDVITELIDLGFGTSYDMWVANVAELLDYMILKRINDNGNNFFYSNDTKVAFAMRGGLVELCLTFIQRFGLLESFDEERHNASSPSASIKSILHNIYWVGLHQKTAKAIRNKKCDIKEVLARLEQDTDITNNAKCKELIEMMRSILRMNGSFCCRCNKPLSRTEVKLCNGCGWMSYCSRTCQRDDWSNGHSLACCKTSFDATTGQFQGIYHPEIPPANNEKAATKLKELKTNMYMIQLKLFLDNAESILTQIEGLELPLYDCVVVFDLRVCPPTVKVQDYSEHFLTPELVKSFEQTRSKENITCDYCSYYFDGELDENGDTPNLVMQRMFPHEWLTNGRRSDAHNNG